MTTATGEQQLCTKCVGSDRFCAWIREHGSRGSCDLDPSHGRARKVVQVSAFAEAVDAWFREHYQRGGEEAYATEDSDNPSYRQRGEPYPDIMMDALECDQGVIDAISEHLPDVTHRDIAQGAEPFYDDTDNYESIAEVARLERADQEEYWFANRFRYQWEEFCETVQYERRFFRTKELLDDLFGKPEEYEGGKINPVYMLPAGQKIYRARVLNDGFTAQTLERGPGSQLSAPSKERARAGRMNVEFIPAFYGAFSEDTAVAEMRPGIGEEVAIGEFTLQHDARVFDFTAFARADHSKWSDYFGHTRYDFINQMEDEISRPVLPFEKQRQYIPTQIVAEYLKEYFKCDAVIYRSSMIKDRTAENRNIVLLPRQESFTGSATSVLTFVRHDVKEVLNVTYQLMKCPF